MTPRVCRRPSAIAWSGARWGARPRERMPLSPTASRPQGEPDGGVEASTSVTFVQPPAVANFHPTNDPAAAPENVRSWWSKQASNLRRPAPADLQSAPFVLLGIPTSTSRCRSHPRGIRSHRLLLMTTRLQIESRVLKGGRWPAHRIPTRKARPPEVPRGLQPGGLDILNARNSGATRRVARR